MHMKLCMYQSVANPPSIKFATMARTFQILARPQLSREEYKGLEDPRSISQRQKTHDLK